MCRIANVFLFVHLFIYEQELLGVLGDPLTDYFKAQMESSTNQGTKSPSLLEGHLPHVLRDVNMSTKCQREVELFLEGFSNRDQWALEMFDATAKLSSGLFSGNAQQLGEYDQCIDLKSPTMRTSNPLDDPVETAGKYCLVLADVAANQDAKPGVAKLIHRVRGENLLISNVNTTGHFVPRFSTVHIGVCIPSGCSASELESALSGLKRNLLPNEVDLNISVKDEMCYTKTENQDLSLSTKCVLGIYCIVVIISIVGTVMDSNCFNKLFCDGTNTRTMTSIKAFSLQRNFKSLLQSKNEDLPCINGIRALCTIMLYLAHKMIILCMTPYNNRHALIQDSHLTITAAFRSSMIYTDTFLLLSGVLSSYNFCKEIRKKGHIAWFHRFFVRYFRLTPALLAILLYYAFVMEHMGSGPQWPTVIKPNADLCKKNMIWNLLYVNNFFPFQDNCVTQSHQLAVDMQLFLITPGLVYLLHYNHCIGFLVIFVLNLGSTFLRYFIVLNNKLSLIIHYGVTAEDLYKAADLCYSQTLHRATPYLFGVYTGFVLHRYKSRIGKRISPFLIGVLWAGIIGGGLWPIWQVAHLSHPKTPYVAHASAVYAALSPFIWALAMSLLIVSCSFGYAGPLQRILSHNGLAFLSRISYPVFLSQFAIFFHRLASIRSSRYYTRTELVVPEEIFIIIVISMTITLLFDLPFQNIRATIIKAQSEERNDCLNGDSKVTDKRSKKKD
ncbi:unnamed protein product [Bemisia tabaci]|uniref:Nose resistant-to-fluoxetine protein N-terminal domain-containing protein n=1 Tax=Bemisia tabaci TaxID=7038 RepID=A0A9P0AK15_BEMTA|nr:unnamed protein product [Bemisia tabaci]